MPTILILTFLDFFLGASKHSICLQSWNYPSVFKKSSVYLQSWQCYSISIKQNNIFTNILFIWSNLYILKFFPNKFPMERLVRPEKTMQQLWSDFQGPCPLRGLILLPRLKKLCGKIYQMIRYGYPQTIAGLSSIWIYPNFLNSESCLCDFKLYNKLETIMDKEYPPLY